MVEAQAYIRLKAISNGQAGVERHKQESSTLPRIFLIGQKSADQKAIALHKAETELTELRAEVERFRQK